MAPRIVFSSFTSGGANKVDPGIRSLWFLSPRVLLWVREWRQKSPSANPETPAPETPPRKTAPSATTGGKPGVGPFPPPDSPSRTKLPSLSTSQSHPTPVWAETRKSRAPFFISRESHWAEKGGRTPAGACGAGELQVEEEAGGPGMELKALESPHLRRESGFGTPGCQSVGTHLVDGGEIHGGAESR